ncbi:hypothetical protein O3G_MSEX003837 [Manduca sexta]|uniref:4-nitrophenylphosphatase n=2 Tax=Manduca sexta TaxID=7130 RepID=A0A922CGF1_MANSE|nr:hypothetical protein O3G_MSEX003837 [Manduca sexta]
MESVPVNLLELGKSEVQNFLDSFDHVFSDCDGVIWSKGPLPGSSDFFNFMKKHGKTVNFVSNNSLRTRANYEAQFKASGIDNGFANLTIPSLAIAEYLKSVNFDKTVYCVTCEETIHVLEAHGFKCKQGPDVGPEFYGEFLKFLEDDEEIGAVVFDSDFKVNLPKLYKAITYLKRPDVLFLNGATDRVVPLKPGCLALGKTFFNWIVHELNIN